MGVKPRRAADWRSGLIASGAALAICALLVLVALVGTTARPGPLFRDQPVHRAPVTMSQSAPPAGGGTRRPPQRQQGHPLLAVLLVALLLAMLAVAVFGLWMWWQFLLGLVEFRHRRRVRSLEIADDVEIDVVEQAGRAVAGHAPQLRALLLAGEPRNAIVACWSRLEEVAASAGLQRRSWETSSEFVIRLLDGIAGDGGATERLGILFREARYSRHPITEEARREAVALLDRILAEIRSGAR